MLKPDRQWRLLELLRERDESIRVTELSQLLGVTPITVRRDVAELAHQGRVIATHGGVRLLTSTVSAEPVYQSKLTEEMEAKERIAERALATVPDGSTIFLDGGTTVGALAKRLTGRRMTVVTNALNVANVLARSRHIRLILIGGTFRPQSLTFLGPKAVHMLEGFRFDIAFLGTEGFDWDRGFEVPDESDAEFKWALTQAAAQVTVLAAGSKLGKRYLYRFAAWSEVHTLVASRVEDTNRVPHEHQGTKLLWV